MRMNTETWEGAGQEGWRRAGHLQILAAQMGWERQLPPRPRLRQNHGPKWYDLNKGVEWVCFPSWKDEWPARGTYVSESLVTGKSALWRGKMASQASWSLGSDSEVHQGFQL